MWGGFKSSGAADVDGCGSRVATTVAVGAGLDGSDFGSGRISPLGSVEFEVIDSEPLLSRFVLGSRSIFGVVGGCKRSGWAKEIEELPSNDMLAFRAGSIRTAFSMQISCV